MLGVVARTGSRADPASRGYFGSPDSIAHLPRDLVEVAVVEHENDRRGSLHRFQYFAMVMSSLMPFICIAPSPVMAMTGRSGNANFAAIA